MNFQKGLAIKLLKSIGSCEFQANMFVEISFIDEINIFFARSIFKVFFSE